MIRGAKTTRDGLPDHSSALASLACYYDSKEILWAFYNPTSIDG